MKCCACIGADVIGYLHETGDNVYWAVCLECMELYEGQGVILIDEED